MKPSEVDELSGKILDEVKQHTEQYKSVNGYDCPYNYKDLLDYIRKAIENEA